MDYESNPAKPLRFSRVCAEETTDKTWRGRAAAKGKPQISQMNADEFLENPICENPRDLRSKTMLPPKTCAGKQGFYGYNDSKLDVAQTFLSASSRDFLVPRLMELL